MGKGRGNNKMSYRKTIREAKAPVRYKNNIRRLEVAFMRLDHRFCVKALVILVAAMFFISGIIMGFLLLLAYGIIAFRFGF